MLQGKTKTSTEGGLLFIFNMDKLGPTKRSGVNPSFSHTTVYGYFKQAELDPAVIEKICKIFKISVNQCVGELLTGRTYPASNEPEMLNMDYDVVKLQKENAELKTRLIDALERIIELNDNLRKLQEKKESN